jgi:hypothetical protein
MELLTTEQAAQQLGVTPGTLMTWRCTKGYALKFIKIGWYLQWLSGQPFPMRSAESAVEAGSQPC